nr:hypothetical protein [Tanacetum cinerariifolium]
MLHVLRVEMVINSPWMLSKNWLVQKQTDFGKDISNPFIADNLPKIIWFSTHHVTYMKSWLVQKQMALGQMATGKESSNPFMAVKRSCDVTRLQALVDKKKIVISEAVIREILQLNDAEGVAELYKLDLDHSSKVLSKQEDDTEVQEAVEIVTTAKLMTEVVTAAATQNTEGYKMDFFKGMKYDEILPIFQAKFDANIRFLFKSREEIEEEDQEIIKSINETHAQKAAKRRKLEPDGQDAIWRNQKSIHGLALVKRWKLLTSCGVYVITLSTVQLFLLVEIRYPLLRFTLEQLVNVARLQVEEESEMSLELLRFTRQQLQEYQQG